MGKPFWKKVKREVAAAQVETEVPLHRLQAKHHWKKEVYIRDRFVCQWCGQAADTIDHIVPKSIGGPDEVWNGLASCYECNQRRGALRASTFLEILNYQVPHLVRLQVLIRRAERKHAKLLGG